jgi:hypothetical protein
MSKSIFAFLVAGVLACAAMSTSAAFARGHGGGSSHGAASGNLSGFPPGFSSQGKRTGWNGGSTPPGWSKGQKKGWNGQNMPPGLYGR